MFTRRFDSTNRHSGRQFHAGGDKNYYDGSHPYISFQWKIEVGGLVIAHFQELSGMTWDTEVVTFQEGGLNDQVHQLMGQTKVTNLVLKNGFAKSMDLWNWRMCVVNSRPTARRNGSLMLTKLDGTPISLWNFERAWPCKWDGPPFTSSSSQLAIETLEIAYERLKRIK